ncbi:MAG: polysaccharide biosynthesis C-terminal domain-containing protein [Lachnospira pectinoschiza]
MIVLLLLVKPIVAVMSTPAAAVSGTITYLTICFIGIPFITAYNIISSIFRGLGDSKSPMYFIIVACGANILLDYLFIGGLHMGAAGAALGTTLSQTISVIVALYAIRKKQTGIRLQKVILSCTEQPWDRFCKLVFRLHCRMDSSRLHLLITIIANRRGLNEAAAVGIVEKLSE